MAITGQMGGWTAARRAPSPGSRALRPRFLLNYARTAVLMAGLVALLAIGGNALGGYEGC